MIRVTVHEGESQVAVMAHAPGDHLLHMLRNAGYLLEAPCGEKARCGKCRIRVLMGNDFCLSPEELDCLSREEQKNGWRLACVYRPRNDIHVEWIEIQETFSFLDDGDIHNQKRVYAYKPLESSYGIAVDIGTTTVVGSLVALETGGEIGVVYAINPQKAYGLDVMSRMEYQLRGQREHEALKDSIRGCLEEIINRLVGGGIVETDKVIEVTIAGNTAMLHFLLGESVYNLARMPYRSAISGALEINSELLGIPLRSCRVYILPPIRGFIGSDISAGILASRLWERKGTVLFVDIGTNGELVLKTDRGLICCSCAAGPAFEGADISCGMRANTGVVEHIQICEDGTLIIDTIHGEAPIGICGSGVIDVIGELAHHGMIGKTGRLKAAESLPTPLGKLVGEDEKGRYFIIENDGSQLRLYQKDLRQIQLAKGAIRSGIDALLQAEGLEYLDIDEIILAGQFGRHLRVGSLVKSGILPEGVEDRVTYVGNSSRKGAELCLKDVGQRREIESVVGNIRYMELSQLEGYDRLFAACLNFNTKEVER